MIIRLAVAAVATSPFVLVAVLMVRGRAQVTTCCGARGRDPLEDSAHLIGPIENIGSTHRAHG